ncbi:MAG: hypothetical protein EZS28_022964 [Streblomastix strix]|uniref:Uncharacterized protein n=1 Tax=Streblomastix strix TaxID=222440 RepID=A0A5J4VGJ8_9EUKA|nr:MAG: hypothetical protein EZS28_022964 [Streblomastix strix]
MELKQAAKDFGDGYDDKKGLFPYEAFNTDNVNEILSKSEPFSMEDFNSSLKKTKISQKDYQIYLDDAKRFKNRWDYLQFHNEQDTYIMIKPLMTLISLQFKYKIDMFSFMSMAACSNAIKYAKAYEDFDINVRKLITGGLSNVMNRVNRSGIDFIKRLWYDKDNKKVTILTTDHRITHVVGVDFNSLYPSVMSSEQHQFIKYAGSLDSKGVYTGGKMYMCGSQTDMSRIHFIEGDTDSAYWAVSGNVNEDFTQQFNAVVKDRDFYNENAKYYFPTIRGDIYDEKKILGLSIERQGISMTALAPKNYMIETNYNGNSKIKLKGVNQKTNKITKEQIVDCIEEGKITKCTNMRLGQKNHQMSQLAIEKNGITGIHDKMIVLENQSCCPFIFGLSSKDYSFQDS